MAKEWFKLGVIRERTGMTDSNDLPGKFWVEDQRQDFREIDPSLIQIHYAESLQQTGEPKEKTVAENISFMPKESLSEAPLQERNTFRRDEI